MLGMLWVGNNDLHCLNVGIKESEHCYYRVREAHIYCEN